MSFSKNIHWSPEEYAEAAVIAHESSDEMLSRLDWMTLQPKVILDIGCGTGKSSAKLAQRYKEATVLALDSSLSMVQYTKDKTPHFTCACAEGEKLPLRDHSVDLIFANFFLPWQQNVKGVLNEWLRVLSPNGLLMVTALGLNTLQEWREVLSSEYTPNWVDMHDVGDALVEGGFADPVLDVNHYQMTYRDTTHLIRDLQASGFWFPNAEENFNQANLLVPREDGLWPLTFEVIFAHAFAPAEKNEFGAANGEVKIPLSQLRRRLG